MGASSAALSRGTVLVFAGLSLAACASVGPRYPAPGEAGGYGGSGRAPSHYGTHGTEKPYEINGRWYYPAEQPDYDEVGVASWYGDQFHNHTTADGEVFDMNLPSAAHKTLPLPSLVEVTNLANGRKMIVRVNDRGPFIDGRIIDMSKQAAKELGFYGQGVAQVRVRYVGPAPERATDARVYQVRDTPPIAAPPVPAPISAQPILGAQIDDRPIQHSPATMDWGAAPVATPLPPAQPAPAVIAAASPATPAPSASVIDTAVVASASAPSGSSTGAPTDVDALLASLAEGTPAAPTAVIRPITQPATQVGAFASRANAERVAAAQSGQAQIVPVVQNGRTLYKVMVIR
ncbi:MAG TPA: septal ring lytic transglycosylase RlpA family protein [Caulobacteraceae bacterium]|nr:septal ring lytic transglycosylase RlpA family protein [Caulobacteraceae bacterium]